MTRLTFWRAFKSTFSGSGAFVVACPLLALVPVAFELAQHGVEVHRGMYDSMAGFVSSQDDPVRLAMGFFKVLSLTLPMYWVIRFLPRRDAAFAARLDARAVRLFAGFLLFQAACAAIELFVSPRTPLASVVVTVAALIVACLACVWSAAAALGNGAIGPIASMRLMARRLAWTFAFLLVTSLVPMVPHYGLAIAALLVPKVLLWPTLILDAFLVGWTAAVLAAASYYAALRAATLADTHLTPGQAARDVGDVPASRTFGTA